MDSGFDIKAVISEPPLFLYSTAHSAATQLRQYNCINTLGNTV